MNASPGGLWIGVDSNAEPVAMLTSEEGLFYFLSGPFDDSTGLLGIMNGDSVNGVMGNPENSGDIGSSGRTDCKLTGSVNERVSMLLDVRCRGSQEEEVLTTLSLEYDPRYERSSSLEQVAGNYQLDFGSVLNIAGDGMIFSQDGRTGCMTIGEVKIIDPRFNVYEIEMIFIECPGVDRLVYHETLFGIAMLDETFTPERLIFSVSDVIEEKLIVISGWADRL